MIVFYITLAIKAGRNIRIRKGTLEAEVSGKDNKET